MNVDDIADPALKKLAAKLPIMNDGKPRRFRLLHWQRTAA